MGLRSKLMEVPLIYDALQNGLAKSESREWFVKQVIRPKTGQRVLDIGCGTASILNQLDGVRYTGIDHNTEYIAKARMRFGTKGVFHRVDLGKENLANFGKFDLVLIIGVLHHLDDGQITRLMGQIDEVLTTTGTVATIDPVLEIGQHPIARLLAILDRGRHVRNCCQYRTLLEQTFRVQSQIVKHDLLKVPYSHAVFCLSKN